MPAEKPLMDKLNELGLTDNTLFIFYSDTLLDHTTVVMGSNFP